MTDERHDRVGRRVADGKAPPESFASCADFCLLFRTCSRFHLRATGALRLRLQTLLATMSLIPFSSQLIADVGISLGDEGKGRLIPEVADELRGTSAAVSVVLKVNGGANSGHTAGGIKLNLLPAGVVVRDAAHLCIGSGVVADPRKIWWETKPLEKKGH